MNASPSVVKLALSGTEIADHEGVEPLVAACRDAGVHWVDLWYPRNTATEGLERVLRRLAAEGIGVASIGTATELGAGEVTRAQATLIEAVSLAGRLGCHFVNTYFGWPSRLDDGQATEAYMRNVEPCLEAARDHGVILTLENEFDVFGVDPVGTDLTRRPASLRHLVETIGSPHFRVAFDPCNALFAGVSPVLMYEELWPFIACVHVKDGVRLTEQCDTAPWKQFSDHGRRYATSALGEGEVGWPRLLELLASHDYRGYLVLEPHSERSGLVQAWVQAAGYLRGTTDVG